MVVCTVGVFGQFDEINIIPKPHEVRKNEGSFKLNRNTQIVAGDEVRHKMAAALNDRLLQNYGFKLNIVSKVPKKNYIAFLTPRYAIRETTVAGQPNSLHFVVIKPDRIEIEGYEEGVFYGLQSLKQLLPPKGNKPIAIPAFQIVDVARFRYRGMHLDVSRHFMPVEFVKKYIDLMAQYKFNTFHWHLTDDQGWRIEIKKYPKLTELGSKRPESHEGSYSTIFKGDGRPVEGFYTQEQIKEVVAYAKARYITVIPEIELPGHASAALAAYPELGRGCAAPDYKFEVKKTWGIFKEVFCPTHETFKFLEDVLDETISLFPDSPYIHIGGDEVLKDYWKESAYVQELKKRENLKDEHEVQSYFIRRIEKFVNSKGKKIIGWDEILEGGIAPNATIMSWRGMKGGIEAAKAKHDVIMTPTDFAYLDYGQGDPAYEPLNIGGYLPLEKVYSFDPVPKELNAEEAKYVIGGQGNIWTEYLETPSAVEYMAFPRMLAIAESVWSTPENKNFDDFQRRLISQFARLDARQVNYRIPPPRNLSNMVIRPDEQFRIENIYSEIPGARVLHTTDGSDPNENSPQISAKFFLSPNGPKVQTLKTIVVLPNGRKSSIYAATVYRGPWLGAQPDPTGKTPGVNYSLYVPSNAYGQDTPAQKGESSSIGLQQFASRIDTKQTFGVTFEGYINIASDEVYEFQIDSTWNRSLTIDGVKLIDEAGTKDRAIKSAVIPLKAGWHKIAVHYDHVEGDMFFRLRYGIKGQGLRQIGGGELVH